MSSRLDYPHATLNVAFRAKDKTEDRKKAAGKVPFAFPFALFSSVSLFAQNGQLKLRAKEQGLRQRQMQGEGDGKGREQKQGQKKVSGQAVLEERERGRLKATQGNLF